MRLVLNMYIYITYLSMSFINQKLSLSQYLVMVIIINVCFIHITIILNCYQQTCKRPKQTQQNQTIDPNPLSTNSSVVSVGLKLFFYSIKISQILTFSYFFPVNIARNFEQAIFLSVISIGQINLLYFCLFVQACAKCFLTEKLLENQPLRAKSAKTVGKG